jgi:hypothetical protein
MPWQPDVNEDYVICSGCGVEYLVSIPTERRAHHFGCPDWHQQPGKHQCAALPEPDARLRFWEKLGRWRLSTGLEDDDGEPVRDGWEAEWGARDEEVDGFLTVNYCPFCGVALPKEGGARS